MVKICFSQIDVEPGHPDLNVERMLQAIDEAKQNNTDIIIFPEMCIPGYLLGDTWEQTAFLKDCFKLWRSILSQLLKIFVSFLVILLLTGIRKILMVAFVNTMLYIQLIMAN